MVDPMHWWRYTRLRLVARTVKGWVRYWGILLKSRFLQMLCRFMGEQAAPFLVGMELIGVMEGLEGQKAWDKAYKAWQEWEKDQLFLGACKNYPNGVWARGGDDLVYMTNEEFKHWYG